MRKVADSCNRCGSTWSNYSSAQKKTDGGSPGSRLEKTSLNSDTKSDNTTDATKGGVKLLDHQSSVRLLRVTDAIHKWETENDHVM